MDESAGTNGTIGESVEAGSGPGLPKWPIPLGDPDRAVLKPRITDDQDVYMTVKIRIDRGSESLETAIAYAEGVNKHLRKLRDAGGAGVVEFNASADDVVDFGWEVR